MPLILDPELRPTDLHGRLAALRRRLRIEVVAAGAANLLAAWLAFVSLAIFADQFLYLPALLRAGLLIILLLGFAYWWHRWILQPWRRAGDDHRLAMRIQRYVPGLHDALASALQFSDDDPTSPDLRAATARYADEHSRGYDFEELVGSGSIVQAAMALAAALLLALMLARSGTLLALARLFDPYGSHPWPTKTVLTLNAPDTIARGESFELQATVSGEVPDRIKLSISHGRAPSVDQSYPLAAETPSMVIRLEPAKVRQSFRYRLTAGDADTGWRDVAVTVPPQLTPLHGRPTPQVRLDFPAYTDLPSVELPDGTGGIEAILGTMMHIRAAVDRPIQRAFIQWRPSQSPAYASAAALLLSDSSAVTMLGSLPAVALSAAPVNLELNADRTQMGGRFRAIIGGNYELVFVDAAGLAGRQRFDLQLLQDPSPSVVLHQPMSSGEVLEVMPGASIPLKFIVDDPTFAIQRVMLEYRTNDGRAIAQYLPLYDGVALGDALPQLLSPTARSPQKLRPQRLELERRIPLASLRRYDGQPLKVGDTLSLAVIANDFDNVTPSKPVGRSRDIELRIVSRERLEARLNQLRSELSKNLNELFRMQTEALEHSSRAESAQKSTAQLQPEDRQRIALSESAQGQLRDRLGNSSEGVRATAERLSQSLADMPGAAASARTQAERIAAELDRLAKDVLEPVPQLLADARQSLGATATEDIGHRALADAVRRQRESARTLNEMLDQLQTGQNLAALAADAAQLLLEQQQLAKGRGELADQLPAGADAKLLSEADRKSLGQLQDRQAQLAQRADSFAQQLNDRATSTARAAEAETLRSRTLDDAIGDTRDPMRAGELRRESEKAADQAETLRQELDALRAAQAQLRDGEKQATIAENMNRAAEALRRNRLSEAKQLQDAANEQLERVREALRDRDIPAAEQLLKQRQRAEEKLNKLIQQQESLQEQTLAAERSDHAAVRQEQLRQLAQEERQLAEQAAELTQQLRRQGQAASARAVEQAAANLAQAQARLERGQTASGDQDDALAKLDDAMTQVRRDRREAEQRLQRERLIKLGERIRGFADRQDNLIAETQRLFDAARAAGGWSRAMQQSFGEMGRSQEGLGQELLGIAEKSAARHRVVQRMTEHAADAMMDAAAAVVAVRESGLLKANHLTDRSAVGEPQARAKRMLAQLLEALEDPTRDGRGESDGKNDSAAPRQDQRNQAQPDRDAISIVAQYKLLQLLQIDLNERTERFAQQHPDPARWTAAQKLLMARLQRGQAELAELFAAIAPEPGAAP